ncbi:multidrug efflux membrane fusion protein [Fulvimarina pelagi HTCC2506]|uniref:Multidrug efflux membrane fusion protein n=2 Tax=Fulvimarina pelagi TaxID=217511 RepID=Q0G7C0_9HYPH|nr:multidrug efflux membrane fusion protein [Fulvimarina pelagi HTCC2506]
MVLISVALAFGSLKTAAAQSSDGGGGGSSTEEQSSTLDLPLIGEVELPDWLAFIGSSSSEQSEGSTSGSGRAAGQGGPGGGQQQPPAVVVTRAEIQSVGDEFEFIGRIEAIENVTLQARVNGFIEEVFFEGGDQVSIGDRLFKIEDDQYQASLDSAEAQLAGADAQLAEAQRALQRAEELIDSGTIPQAELDNARATFESAQASRLQAQADVRQAQLNLDYTSIEAPIDGVISEPMITKGNFVSAASGTLANIVQLDPIWGTFPIGEERISTLRRVGGGDGDAAASAENYRLTLRLPSDEQLQGDGTFAFVGNMVDESTGTIEVRVQFPNPDGRLLPNENVTLIATEREPPQLPVIPMTALQLSREGRFVYLLDDENDMVRQQPVQIGKQMRGAAAITSGVEAGDLVVVQGVQNLQDGAQVTPNFEAGSSGSGGSAAGGAQESASKNGDGGGQTESASASNGSGAQADSGE